MATVMAMALLLPPSFPGLRAKPSALGFTVRRSSATRGTGSFISPLFMQFFDKQLGARISWSQQRRGHVFARSDGSDTGVGGSASVVVTREHGKNGKLVNALGKRGIQCLELPLVEHREGPDLPKLVQTLRGTSAFIVVTALHDVGDGLPVVVDCHRYHWGNVVSKEIRSIEVEFEWIAVTSPEAATVFLQAWKEAGCPKVRVAVVGAGTGELFENMTEGSDHLEVSFTPSKATAKVLAAELPKPSAADSLILYPASLKASNDLETGLIERGFRVLRMNTYSTETVRDLDEAAISAAASAPVATFASPTAVKAWIELVAGKMKWDGAAACIGSTSANAARKAGLQKVFHPENPGIEGWVESIVEALQSQTDEANVLQ